MFFEMAAAIIVRLKYRWTWPSYGGRALLRRAEHPTTRAINMALLRRAEEKWPNSRALLWRAGSLPPHVL